MTAGGLCTPETYLAQYPQFRTKGRFLNTKATVIHMKKSILRLLCPALLLSLCLAGCTPAAPDTETVADTDSVTTEEPAATEAPEVVLTVDDSYCITIPDGADDITRNAAALLVETIRRPLLPWR